MSTLRTGTALAAVVLALVATPSSAAGPRTLLLTDPAGDANAVNGQGLVQGAGGHVGPAQTDEADLVAVSFRSLGSPGPECDGFTVTLELSAPPGTSAMYRVLAKGTRNDVQYWLQHERLPSSAPTTSVRHGDSEERSTTPIAPAVVDGNRITFTVDEKALEKTGERLVSFALKEIEVEVRWSNGEVTAPAWDTVEEGAVRSFAPCRKR